MTPKATKRPTRRAVGYVRVSAVRGREGDNFHSPEVQREKIQAWANYREATIVDWYSDLDVSGTGKVTRPQFDRMMADAKQGKFDVVVVYRLTRFARNTKDAAVAVDILEKADVALVSVTEDIDTGTIAGKLLRNILFALAEFESERLGEEGRNVHARRRAAGKANVTRPMLGYDVAGGGIVAVNRSEADAVRQAFRLRAAGAGLRTIADELAAAGFAPKNANGSGRGFSDSSLRRMLTNPHYAGLLNADGDLIEASHPPIVTRETWDIVQARRKVGRTHDRKALLAGLIRCSGCGEKMWRGHGSKAGQYAYRCSAKWRGVKCPHPTMIRADYVDPHIEELFLSRFDVNRMPNNGRLRGTSSGASKLTRLRKRVADLDAALTRAADAHFVRQSVSAAEYDRQVRRFEHERSEAVGELERLDAIVKTTPTFDVRVLELFPTMPLHTKQQSLRLMMDRVLVHPPNGGKRSQPPSGRGRGGNRFDPSRVEVVWKT
jgi:site-specific DNA recombinase